MAPDVKLTQIHETIGALSYPLSKAEAVDELSGVTVLYADGKEPLEDVLARSNVDGFESAADLESEIYSNLPTEAVGEPGQSEGEG